MNIILISGAEWVSAAGFGKIVTTPIITSTKPYLASTEVVFDTQININWPMNNNRAIKDNIKYNNKENIKDNL